jgi:hypothetical protein
MLSASSGASYARLKPAEITVYHPPQPLENEFRPWITEEFRFTIELINLLKWGVILGSAKCAGLPGLTAKMAIG